MVRVDRIGVCNDLTTGVCNAPLQKCVTHLVCDFVTTPVRVQNIKVENMIFRKSQRALQMRNVSV